MEDRFTKHLNFIEDNSYSGKTQRFHVYPSHDKELLLGIIKWSCAWRQYVIEIEPDTMWSHDCLFCVSTFIADLMFERKALSQKQKNTQEESRE